MGVQKHGEKSRELSSLKPVTFLLSSVCIVNFFLKKPPISIKDLQKISDSDRREFFKKNDGDDTYSFLFFSFFGNPQLSGQSQEASYHSPYFMDKKKML